MSGEAIAAYFDFSGWPILRATMPGPDCSDPFDTWQAGILAALERNEPFAMVIDLTEFDESQETEASRRAGALFFKEHRERIFRLNRVNVYVHEDPAKRRKLSQDMKGRSSALPMLFDVAPDMTQGTAVARALLQDATQDSGR